ncbi:hypothetical protein ACB092_10G016800 [Castanea dentata]
MPCIIVVVAASTNLFIRIQVVLPYMQSSTSSQQFWVRHTMPIEVYCFISKSPTILFLDNICSYNCDMLCTGTSCILTDHSEPVLSPSNKYKICSPLCIFLCNFAEFTSKPDMA